MPTVNEPPATPTKRPDHQEVPELGRDAISQIGNTGQQHQDEKHDASAEAVGPHAQRQADQRAGQHRQRHQHAELGLVEPSVFLIGMPITANIIHTMKQTVNASVLAVTTDQASVGSGLRN